MWKHLAQTSWDKTMRHVLIVLNHRKHESSLLLFSLVLRSKSSGHSNSPFSPLLFFRHPTPPSPSSLPPNSPPPLVKHEFSLLHGGRKGATILNNSLTAIVPHSVNLFSCIVMWGEGEGFNLPRERCCTRGKGVGDETWLTYLDFFQTHRFPQRNVLRGFRFSSTRLAASK